MTWSDRPAVLALLLAVALAGCRGEPPRGFALRELVQDGSYKVGERTGDGLAFPLRRPELVDLELDHERRPVVLAAPGSWTWRGRVPEGARLAAGVQLLPAAWRVVRSLQAVAVVREGGSREVLDVARAGRGGDPMGRRWLDLAADLSPYAGREVTLELSARLDGLPPRHRDSNLVAWGPVILATPPASPPRPNVLFLLVDTLRRDRLTPYGYRRDTSPEIARRLAAAGTVVEEAYSQAPWTLPSVVSFLTGRLPGEVLAQEVGAYGMPPGLPTLAERFAALGYETGGFVANPTLHAAAGFGRGFGTFYAPPADVEWIRRHADELNAHAAPWLRAHQGRPFFAYVHYIDPHDPYENPDTPGGRSPFLPGYAGPVTGDWAHGLFVGNRSLPDPRRDLPQLDALYDSEVRYVDRHVGALLDALAPEALAETLVVLTSDHGEELFDHGGWKHGQTLYEEQIHVPLIVRWDGRVPAGRRLPGTVRLLDLAPTLVAAAGGEADPAWDGVDLLPALTGRGRLRERPAFAQHLSSGPLRAAVVLGREKLLLFNREEPFAPADDLQAHWWREDMARLGRVELYDLARDPAERRNLAGERSGQVARLAPMLHRSLRLPGLSVLAEGLSDLPGGSRLGGTIRFARAPERWGPLFLASGDRVELAGRELRFDLGAEALDKGFRVEGGIGRVESVALALDGAPLPAARVRLGGGDPYGGGAVDLRRLLASGGPGQAASEPGLRLWIDVPRVQGRASDPETEQRMRALGYIK